MLFHLPKPNHRFNTTLVKVLLAHWLPSAGCWGRFNTTLVKVLSGIRQDTGTERKVSIQLLLRFYDKEWMKKAGYIVSIQLLLRFYEEPQPPFVPYERFQYNSC